LNGRRYSSFGDRGRCRFCRTKTTKVDYKDFPQLAKLCTGQGKLFSRKRSGNCARHQRQAKFAVKVARRMALMPYLGS
jgi:small subunit ribosomal protein S18